MTKHWFSSEFLKGGPGSGNFGHSGRPGQIGGSFPDGPVKVADAKEEAGGEKIPLAPSTFRATPQEFKQKFDANFKDSKYKNHVTHYSEEELGGMKALLFAEGGKVGMAVKDHGDGRIEGTALFSDPDAPKGSGLKLLAEAIAKNGVNYVECYGEFLPRYYEKLGFVVKDKFPFDKSLAAKDWDYGTFGEPNYYTMVYKGKNNG